MSDFIHTGWSLYVAVGTVAGLLGCLVVLLLTARRKVLSYPDNSTGHVWDGDLRELNNPLPRWWMGLFILTVVFAGAYLALYPGLGSAPGALQWSSQGQLQAEQDRARSAMQALYQRYAGQPVAALAADPAAMGIGQRLFINHCATCHGSDARGSKGFPDLTDADWLHGGDHDSLIRSITEGRRGVMPPMAAAVGSAEDVHNLAHHVLSLSGSPHNRTAAQLGKSRFGACAACHGADGKGNTALGAPNLTDTIWLHGWGEAAIAAMVNQGKTNVMPPHAERLTPEQIRVLAAYVWSLSNRRTVPAS